MVNITLSIPDDLKKNMDTFLEINWSAIARQAFAEKIKDLQFIKEFKSKSKATEEDAIKLGRALNSGLIKREK